MVQLARACVFVSCLLMACGLLLPPPGVTTRPAADDSLVVHARIYPKNSDKVEVLLDPRGLSPGYYIVGGASYEVNFYGVGGKLLGAETFTYKKDMLRHHVYRQYEDNPFKAATKEAKAKNPRYKRSSLGIMHHFNSTLDPCYQPGKTVKNLKAEEALEVNWSLMESSADDEMEIYPYLIRRANGKFSPVGGYRWVNLADPNDFRVELLPNLRMSDSETVVPKRGYSWAKPYDSDDFGVVLMPGLVENSDGTFSLAGGYRWFSPDDKRCAVLM